MNLSYRPAAPHEISALLKMLPEELKLTKEETCLVTALWRKWRIQGMMLITAIEHSDELGKQSTVAFGASVFVTNKFVSELSSNSKPPALMALVHSEERGENPVLTANEIRKANSTDGLNLLIPIIGWQHDIEDPSQLSRVKAKLLEAFYYAHGGYNIKDTIQEVYGEYEMKRALAAGALVRNDYGAASTGNSSSQAERPYLIGVHREEAVEGTYLHPIYLFNPPKLMFTLPEQNVLELAILDMTDNEIANALSVGDATIKKRWRSIIDRANAARHVVWHPHDTGQAPAARPGRGLEKRRHIITYVRSHLEELRPYAPRKD